MPYLGYFQAIAAVDKYILYDNLAYIVNGWVNKNRIRERNHPPTWLIVPIKQKSSFALIRDTRIDNSQPWQRKMLIQIRQGYSRAAFFKEVFPLFEEILTRKYETISELNAYSVKKICEFMEIRTEIVSDSCLYQSVEDGLALLEKGDYSAFPAMTKTYPIKKVARVIALCDFEGADHFVNAIGGTELYSKEEFATYGIKLDFIKMHDIMYSQNSSDDSFEPHMSIIDVLMHNGKEGTKQLLKEYTLV